MEFFSFNQLPLYTKDFYFRELNDNNKDAIVIFNPIDSMIVSPVYFRSEKSLEDHITYICNNNIKKTIVIAENIEFIKREIAKQWGKGSAWSRGVTAYADMILENIADVAQWYSAQGQEFPDITENLALNGATSWEQWAYGG